MEESAQEGHRGEFDLVDNARTFHLGAYFVLSTVKTTADTDGSCVTMVKSEAHNRWKPLGLNHNKNASFEARGTC